MRDLKALREGWNRAAREDPMFNIITAPEYAGGAWPVEEFFAHGQREIDELLAYQKKKRKLRSQHTDYALDFGCGIGRLTQALYPEYHHVVGVDISKEMVRLARQYNRWGKNVRYVTTAQSLTTKLDMRFDLIYSRITLQHMPADVQREYVREFVELLTPTGRAVFQIPEGPYYQHPQPWLSMYGVPRHEVEDWVADAGGELLDVQTLPDSSQEWVPYRYTVSQA